MPGDILPAHREIGRERNILLVAGLLVPGFQVRCQGCLTVEDSNFVQWFDASLLLLQAMLPGDTCEEAKRIGLGWFCWNYTL